MGFFSSLPMIRLYADRLRVAGQRYVEHV